MKHILLIGGDARSLGVIHTLSNAGHNLSVIGFEQYDFTDAPITQLTASNLNLSLYDVIILPVDGVSQNGEVNCPYATSPVSLTEEMILATPKHCKILSGIANDYLKAITAPRRLELIFARNDIALYNAIPTAEATLKIALEETAVTIHHTPVAVIGFGRVGATVANLFQQVGADVTAFMRSDEDFAKSAVMGIRASNINQLTDDVAFFSICINTVPDLIIDETILRAMAAGTLIIDLASKPGGTDFEAADKLDIKTIHALGLPGKTAPITAGNILAATIMKMLEK